MSSESPLFDISLAHNLAGHRIACNIVSNARLTAISGPSGIGKTSVLNMVAGLIRPDSGHIRINGQTLFDAATGVHIAPEQRRIGYAFQDNRLFPHLSVAANLAFSERYRAEDERWIEQAQVIDLLEIGHLATRRPRDLSGGEARRVAIGRALLAGARLLLLDEPLASLDPARREDLMRAIERIRDTLHIPILYVSHDARETERLAGKTIAMEQFR
jgi:molybdate transport system ATP-binding protein